MDSVIPVGWAGGDADNPIVREWTDAVLTGDDVGLVLIGSSSTGKTHAAYAAMGRLLALGFPQEIAVLQGQWEADYGPGWITSVPQVVLLDDLTQAEEQYRWADTAVWEPVRQAEIAVKNACRAAAMTDIVYRAAGSWITVGSSVTALRATVGTSVADHMLSSAYVAHFADRRAARGFVTEW